MIFLSCCMFFKLFHGELERLTKILKKSKASEKEMYSKMFWGSNPPNMDKPVLQRKGESLVNTCIIK